MTKKFTYSAKANGDQLTADEWNNLAQDVDAAVDAINAIPASSGSSDGVVTVTDVTVPNGDATVNVAIASGVQDIASPDVIQFTKKKKGVNTTLVSGNNINIEPRESVGETKGGNISFKPGDDIEFCSHHRLAGNQNEVSVKVIDGNDVPVKLQLNASEMVLTTKIDKNTAGGDLDITVNNQTDTRGYLKVRAQAIDLRSESHGGIALQPRGEDGNHNEDKIKFEHGGGDGLEFGTFNTEKSSLFTNEYRFKKDGVIKLATRTKLDNTPGGNGNDKYTGDNIDPTTHYSYQKQADDFYDIIDVSDPTCTWGDIVKYVAWAKKEQQGPWEPITPILAFDTNNYTAYIGEEINVNATINPSSLQSQVRYSSSNSTELGLTTGTNTCWIEPTTTGTYQIAAQFAGNSQYNAVTARTSVIVKPARQDTTLTMTAESGIWSASAASISNSAYNLEVAPAETISGAHYNWSTYPEGILTFTPVGGHPDGDAVTIGLTDPNYTGTFTVYAEFTGTDDYKPTDVSHTYTITA